MRILSLLIVLVSAVFALTGCQTYPWSRTTTTTTSNQVIVTRAPAAKEVVRVPRGYYKCFKVEAGWYNNVWVPTHKVCKYRHAQVDRAMWVSGYWQCDAFNAGTCNNWTWVSGHWANSRMVY